jgi:Ca2+-binding EF-hand superfamily protein
MFDYTQPPVNEMPPPYPPNSPMYSPSPSPLYPNVSPPESYSPHGSLPALGPFSPYMPNTSFPSYNPSIPVQPTPLPQQQSYPTLTPSIYPTIVPQTVQTTEKAEKPTKHKHRTKSKSSVPEWMGGYKSSQDEENTMKMWFQSVDQDHTNVITGPELKAALEAGGEKVSKETVALMMKMFDKSQENSINADEFGALFKYIGSIRAAFDALSLEGRSHFLELHELKPCLSRLRFEFGDEESIMQLFFKFSSNKNTLNFSQFMEICLRLGNLRTVEEKKGHRKSFIITGTVVKDL